MSKAKILADELQNEVEVLQEEPSLNKKSKKKKKKKDEFEQALEEYKPRPANAVPSRKKSQRRAEEVREYLKESKKVKQIQEKQQEDATKQARRVELYERLSKVNSEHVPVDKKELQTSSKLTRNDHGVQKKKKKKKNVASSRVVLPSNDDDESGESSDEEDGQTPPAGINVTEKEEIGLIIPPTPPPVEISKNKVDADMTTESVPKDKEPVQSSKTPSAKDEPRKMEDKSEPFVVHPERPAGLQEERMKLPITYMEQEIMEAINHNDVVFISGETGSGKTTQVPQFLIEAGFGCLKSCDYSGQICVAQPRRVACINVATRVGLELGAPLINFRSKQQQQQFGRGDRNGTSASSLIGSVGYQIRYDSKTCSDDYTRLKFATDGILLRECKEDLLLSKYSCIILDEVHERGVNTDLLLGLLSRIVPLRAKLSKERKDVKPLKLILMSATIDVKDFKTSLGFHDAPVLKTETRQFSVTPHFSRRTEQIDYVNATLKKCYKIHEKLPPGGILVFLTGQMEIEYFCRALNERYNEDDHEEVTEHDTHLGVNQMEFVKIGSDDNEEAEEDDTLEEEAHTQVVAKQQRTKRRKASTTKESVGPTTFPEYNAEEDEEFSDLTSDEEGEADGKGDDMNSEHLETKEQQAPFGPVHVVPLFSRLSSEKQKLVFIPPKNPEARFIVVSTNIAETSLTIPGIRYVVDCGREKKRVYDQKTGTSTFKVDWISQSSAKQRMGRAGRLGPGHCYRVYSSAVYTDIFQEKSTPEIHNVPIDDLVLYMKNMGIDRIHQFPFPTRLNESSVNAAFSRLKLLGILNEKLKVTALGKLVADLPTSVRVGKMIVVAREDNRFQIVMPHLLAVASLMSLPKPFDTQKVPPIYRADGSSDSLALLRAAGAYTYLPNEGFCAEQGINFKIMREFEQLFKQLLKVTRYQTEEDEFRLHRLHASEEVLIKQAVIAGLIDQVARRMDIVSAKAYFKANAMQYPPRKYFSWPYELANVNEQRIVFIHADSVILPTKEDEEEGFDFSKLPEYIVYTSVNEFGKMEGCTVVESKWLIHLSPDTSSIKYELCETPESFYSKDDDTVYSYMRPKFGLRMWQLPIEKMQCKDEKLAYSAFARALLEGKVVGKFLEENKASAPFAHCTKAPLQIRVANLVNTLMKNKISSRQALVEKWESDPMFLCKEVIDWIRPDYKDMYRNNWIELVVRKGD